MLYDFFCWFCLRRIDLVENQGMLKRKKRLFGFYYNDTESTGDNKRFWFLYDKRGNLL